MKAGQWYHVTWIDAVQDANGDAKDARIVARQNIIRYLRTDTHEWRKVKSKFHTFAMGLDQQDQTNAGWFAIPQAMILSCSLVVQPKAEFTTKEVGGS